MQEHSSNLMTILTEGLNYLDMEGQVFPTFLVDEYAAKMGTDKDIVHSNVYG